MKAERVSYAWKRVYIGIDVHRAFFVASCVCDGVVVKRVRMPPKSEAVISLIRRYFPESEVCTCYEAGYSGFWLHRELCAAGISNIVVHAASIEVAANDRVKTDKRDSLKMAHQLAAGRLKGIRIPSVEQEQERLLTRTREQLMRAKRRERPREGQYSFGGSGAVTANYGNGWDQLGFPHAGQQELLDNHYRPENPLPLLLT